MIHKPYFTFLSVLLVVLFQVSNVFALEAPSDLRVTSASDSELYLDWSDVQGAVWYYLYYGTVSWEGGSYEVEGVNLIEESEYILWDLQANMQYYIAITAADESILESEFSDEISFKTLSSGSEIIATSLRIEEVNPIDETSLEMIFSKNLITASNAVREFILENTKTKEEIFISLSEVDEENPNRLIALLDSELAEGTEYELTVLDIQDEDGGSITLWIDAFITFTTESFESETDMTSAGPEDSQGNTENQENLQNEETQEDSINDQNTETITQEDSQSDSWEQSENEWNNAWETISIENNTTSTAESTEKLPQAGPEHWILVFLAFVLAAGMYYKTRK